MPRTTQYEESGSGSTASSVDDEMIAEAFAFAGSPEASPAVTQANERVPLASPKPLDGITESSRSEEEGNLPEESSSPLFILEDQVDTATTDDLGILVVAAKQGTDTEQRGQRRGPEAKTRLGFTTPAPSQAQPQVNEVGIRQQREISGGLPSGFRDSFFSDEEPAAMHSSSLPEPEPCPEKDEENMNPEDVWKQAVGDDIPPEVMCRIVTVSPTPRDSYDIDHRLICQNSCCIVLSNPKKR
jgi:hypothetical protein